MTSRHFLLIGIALLAGLLVAGGQDAPPPSTASRSEQMSRFREIRRACNRAGLKGVRLTFDGRRYKAFCDQGQDQVDAMVANVTAKPPVVIRVNTVTDALAVLKTDPENVSARQVLARHYDQLWLKAERRRDVQLEGGKPR